MAHTHVSYNMYVNNVITDANHVNNIKHFISTANSILEINSMEKNSSKNRKHFITFIFIIHPFVPYFLYYVYRKCRKSKRMTFKTINIATL